MIRQILKAWHENRGNLLLLLGSLAGLLMCLIWYFQLVPEVSLMSRGIPGTLISTSPRPNATSLVALVRRPVHSSTKPSSTTDVVTGEPLRAVVEVYSPHGTLSQQTTPLLVQAVTLRDDGVPVAVVFHDLRPGKYAAVAYIDVNGNGSFDTREAESGNVTEPFCLARTLGRAHAARVENEASGSAVGVGLEADTGDQDDAAAAGDSAASTEPLPPGIFEVTAAQATLVVLDFEEPE